MASRFPAIQREIIFVLDFGSQYSQLITRRIRELGVYSELVPYTYPLQQMRHARGIILSGGPNSVYVRGAPRVPKELFAMGIPILGICYGMQLMTHLLGGRVERSDRQEFGPATLKVTQKSLLFKGLPKAFSVWMSHGDNVTKLPRGFIHVGHTANSPDAVIEYADKKFSGVQFHPEVEHTPYGSTILKNFLFTICGCKKTWNIDDFIEAKVQDIRRTVGDGHVICATSGGIDSSVTAALVGKAIGKRLTCIFVNQGTMRKGEPERVVTLLREQLGLSVKHVNAEQQFLRALRSVTYGETKRKIIGREFIRVFQRVAKTLRPRPAFLAQGTIHSDVVESARTKTGAKTHTIKTHHNVGGLPKTLHLKLVEPLRDIFKDEVRAVAKALGMPEHVVWRQPFPGPGLAIRVVGEVTKQKLNILRNADAIVQEEIEARGWGKDFYHYFAILLNDKTVGVVGDTRLYAYPIVVKVIVSSDIMTSDWARLPHDFLARLSWRITNEVRGVARVLYDITTKPPGTTEWE